MNILEWVFQDLGNRGARESVVEEHNRYKRPPKGVSVHDWFVNITRAKYGDFVQGKVFNREND